MICTIQQFFEAFIEQQISDGWSPLTPHEIAEFPAAQQTRRNSLRLTDLDATWLRRIKIDPDGD